MKQNQDWGQIKGSGFDWYKMDAHFKQETDDVFPALPLVLSIFYIESITVAVTKWALEPVKACYVYKLIGYQLLSYKLYLSVQKLLT